MGCGPLHARDITGIGRRLGGRHLREKIREISQVIVGEAFGHLRHDLDHLVVLFFRGSALPLAKHVQLDQQVRRRLPADRGNFRSFGLSALAVARKARHRAFRDGLTEQRLAGDTNEKCRGKNPGREMDGSHEYST